MPYLTEEELQELQVQLDQAKEEKRVADYSHNKALRDEREAAGKFKIATIILGILALLGVAGTIYFMSFNTDGNTISKSAHNKKVENLQEKINTLEESNGALLAKYENGDFQQSEGSLSGETVYAVQIGAFEKKDLSLYSDGFTNFKEIRAGEYNKYALGNFKTLEEAKRFRKEMVRMGFRDAFIASYQNNQRVKIEEAW
ncbi:SPOR domain-containing protein [Aquimarina sp. W85]|uniref:SPOR domain-containing protein n=1 Tax=Aquimarina rhodophyticola TaxID=3342246 RepID=UPI0036724B33